MSGFSSMAAETSLGEDFAIDGQRMAAGHARFLGRREQQRIQAAQFFLEEPGAVSGDSLFRELLQTSSASWPVLCAAVEQIGRISMSTQRCRRAQSARRPRILPNRRPRIVNGSHSGPGYSARPI